MSGCFFLKHGVEACLCMLLSSHLLPQYTSSRSELTEVKFGCGQLKLPKIADDH